MLNSSNKYEAITAINTTTNAPQKKHIDDFQKEIPFQIKRQNLRKLELTQWYERVRVCVYVVDVLTIINIQKRNIRKKVVFFFISTE